VKSIRDKAVAMQVYAWQAKDRELLDNAVDVRVRAEIMMGKQLHAMKMNGERTMGGRPQRNESSRTIRFPKLADLGLTATQSSHWQRLANLPADLQEAKVEAAKDKVSAVLTTSCGGMG
jgi:hypothetical protein